MNRVLIIEDESSMRDLYKSLLEDQFYELSEAENGTQALEMAKEEPYDLYITDIMMPKMSGMEFLRELKKADPNAHVIIVTGYDDISYNRKAIEYGAWRYLVKPVSRGEFLNVVRMGLIEHNKLVDPDFMDFEQVPQPVPEPDSESTSDSAPEAEPEGILANEPLLKDITFKKLEQLNAEDALDIYRESEEDFLEFVEMPLQQLLEEIANQLPEYMQSVLESEEKLFEPIVRKQMKKEFAVNYYYGAFYPKGGNKSQDGQLYVAINEDRFEYGFIIGEYGDDQRLVFIGNLRNHKDQLVEDLEDIVKDSSITMGSLLAKLMDAGEIDQDEMTPILSTPNSSPGGTHACYQIPREKAITYTLESMVELVLAGFIKLYPLLVLTTGSDALEKLNRSSSFIPSQEELESWLEKEITTDTFQQQAQPQLQPRPASITEFPAVETREPEPSRPIVHVPERRYEPPAARIEPVYESSFLFYQPRFLADEEPIIPEPPARWKSLLKRRHQIFLRGGSDVQYMAENLARLMIKDTQGFRDTLILHPSLKYSDLVRQPKSIYPDGFMPLFFEAAGNTEEPCVLILNHFDTSDQLEILGEYIYLLQNRGTKLSITRSSEFLVVPKNVYLIATGNGPIEDTRVREVFPTIEYKPDYTILGNYLPDEKAMDLLSLLQELFNMQPELENAIGVQPFLRERDELEELMPDIWDIDILPLFTATLQQNGLKPSEYNWERLVETKLSSWK